MGLSKNGNPMGRKPMAQGERLEKQTCRMSPEDWRWVETQGRNRSEGLRVVVETAKRRGKDTKTA